MKTGESIGRQALPARNRVHAPSDAHRLGQGIALAGVLVVAGVLYAWKLDQNGWANAYYSAAVQAGQHDLVAFFYGSSDWGNSITVDKPPLSLWVMGLSVRLLGFSPTAMLIPQVFMGILTTLLVYLILRRCVSSAAALLGAIVFFTTPIVT